MTTPIDRNRRPRGSIGIEPGPSRRPDGISTTTGQQTRVPSLRGSHRRRRVLFATMGALGLAPTAAAAAPEFRAPSPSDFTLTGRSAKRVVILGGGIAG